MWDQQKQYKLNLLFVLASLEAKQVTKDSQTDKEGGNKVVQLVKQLYLDTLN